MLHNFDSDSILTFSYNMHDCFASSYSSSERSSFLKLLCDCVEWLRAKKHRKKMQKANQTCVNSRDSWSKEEAAESLRYVTSDFADLKWWWWFIKNSQTRTGGKNALDLRSFSRYLEEWKLFSFQLLQFGLFTLHEKVKIGLARSKNSH